MKKIIIIMCLMLSLYLFNYKEYNINEESIRFRVIANSNSSKDILMKEKTVKELSKILFMPRIPTHPSRLTRHSSFRVSIRQNHFIKSIRTV